MYDRAAGVWIARISLGIVSGKRIRRKVRAPTERAAKAELEALRRVYAAGMQPSTDTLDRYLSAWLRTHRPTVRASTIVSYTGHVTLHISPLLGGIPLVRLRPADVRRLIADRLARGLSPATVGRIVSTLRIALTQAVRDGLVPSDATQGVKLPRVEYEPVAALSEAQAAAITDAARGTFMEALVVLLLGSGIRLGEACGLDQADVDLERAYVLVRRSKTQVRAVRVSDDAVEALRGHLASLKRMGPREPVFVGPRSGERLTTATISHAFPRLLEKAGLSRLTPHGLRHGAASLMVAQGVHMRVVAEQLGHRNPAVTARIYAHVTPEGLSDAVRTLNRRKA